MSLQCARIIERKGIHPVVKLSARDEVFKPIKHLIERYSYGLVDVTQIDEMYAADNMLLKEPSWMKKQSEGFDEVYYVIPDLLFNNKYAFDYVKYHTSPQMIRSTKIFDMPRTSKGTIYLGLMTTTDGYMFSEPMNLATTLAYQLPEYKIYMPLVSNWASKSIRTIDIPGKLPSNLQVDIDPDFNTSLDILMQSCYFVGTDNGPSHIAYHASIPRLLLDPQYNRLPWIARWREDYLESVPITAPLEDIVDVVKSNLRIPQTTLVPRMVCLVQKETNWSNLLWLKTE